MFKKEKGGIRGKLTPKVNNWPVWEVPALTKSFSTHGLQVFFFFRHLFTQQEKVTKSGII